MDWLALAVAVVALVVAFNKRQGPPGPPGPRGPMGSQGIAGDVRIVEKTLKGPSLVDVRFP